MIYSLPALSNDNEFTDLAFVGRYVDGLFADTGNRDYLVVYEWDDESQVIDDDDDAESVDVTDNPPDAVLLRIDGKWERQRVKSTLRPDGDYDLSFEPE